MAEKNKKTTASKRKKSAATTVKKEVVDTGAAQEFVEMMVNKPVSEIETKVDDENNTVIVKAKVENSIDMIEVTTTVVEPEQKENSITVDVQEDDNYMTIQGHPDPIDSIDNVDINGVGVPCQDSKCVGVVGPNCDDVTVYNIDAEIEITNMIVDEMANDIDDKVVNQTPDDVDSGLDVPRNEDGWPILPTEGIVSFGNIDEKVNDMVDSEICKMTGEIVDELTKTEEMPKPQFNYVRTAMGVSYD